MAIYSGFSHWKWWFSIVMLVYQRVLENHPMLEFFAVSCFSLPGYILPVAVCNSSNWHAPRSTLATSGTRPWAFAEPHQIQHGATQGKCKMETSPKALRDSNIRQPSTCFGLQKMAEVLSHNLDGSGPQSRSVHVATQWSLPVTFQWPAFHPSTCHGRGLWTHQGPQHQASRFWAVFSIFQPLGFSKAKTCIGWSWGQHMSEPVINCLDEHGWISMLLLFFYFGPLTSTTYNISIYIYIIAYIYISYYIVNITIIYIYIYVVDTTGYSIYIVTYK